MTDKTALLSSNQQCEMALQYVATIRKSGGPRDHKDQLLVDLADELKNHMWWERTASELQRQRDELTARVAELEYLHGRMRRLLARAVDRIETTPHEPDCTCEICEARAILAGQQSETKDAP